MAGGRPVLLCALASPAAMMLAASPAIAALPGQVWLPVCSSDGTHWIALPRDPKRPGDPPPTERQHGMCAHAMLAREKRAGGKIRLPG